VEELGMALAETLLQTVAMEQEGTRVTAMGIDLANAPLQAILAEQERKHNERLRQERLSVAALGKALADTQFQTLIAEQTLVAEQSRIKTIGILIGKAVSSAIENALAKIDEP
jgi:cell division protein FtsL